MSTTSFKSDKYKYGYNKTVSKDGITSNQSFLEQFKSRQKRREIPLNVEANDKNADELSSFIAEFSYITNIPIKISKKENPRPLHSFQVYPINSIKNDAHIFSLHNSAPYKSKKSDPALKDITKKVEWKDLKRNSPLNKKKYHSISGTDLTDTTITIDTEEESTSDPKKYNKVAKNKNNKHARAFRSRDRDYHKRRKSRSHSVKARNYPQIFQSRDRDDYERHMARSRSRQHTLKKSRSRHRKRPRQSRSKRRKPRRRLRSQSRSSKSLVKYWPLRYERKRSKDRRVHKKRKELIPAKEKIQVKQLEVSDSPTIVTLYPSNFQCVHTRACQYDQQFMADRALPCKCFECMRKYMIMKQISAWTACRRYVNCTACSLKYTHQQKEDEWPRSEYLDTDDVPCENLYMDESFRPPKSTLDDYYEEIESEASKSFYFKLNSYTHHINSTIKKYFVSILNDSTYS